MCTGRSCAGGALAEGPMYNRSDLRARLREFERALSSSGLQESASASYVGSAERFVRWLEGDYRPRNASGEAGPLTRGPWSSAALQSELDRYRVVLTEARLRPLAIQTYVHSAGVFLRWIAGDYRPKVAKLRDAAPAPRKVGTDSSLPFARYQLGGTHLLGIPNEREGTARHGYGPPVFAACGYQCAYCGFDMASPYEAWLNLSVDHVVPQHLKKAAWPREWLLDLINLVTCCRACNEFLNGYRVTATTAPESLPEFVQVRDRVFVEKLQHAQKRHSVERERFAAARPAGPTDAQEELVP
jgi:5-methylcytosine-specific restriction endonuclease McrA